jgi:hypothetical protein
MVTGFGVVEGTFTQEVIGIEAVPDVRMYAETGIMVPVAMHGAEDIGDN